jgi:hypothetical protein
VVRSDEVEPNEREGETDFFDGDLPARS